MNDTKQALEAVVGLVGKWRKRRRSYKPHLQARNEGYAAAADELEALLPAIKAALEDARRYRTVRSAVYRDNVEIGEARLILRVTGACPDEREFDAAIDAAQEVGK